MSLQERPAGHRATVLTRNSEPQAPEASSELWRRAALQAPCGSGGAGAHPHKLAGLLLQGVNVDLPLLLRAVDVRREDGRLQLERLVAVDLAPVDGAVGAVDGLVAELRARAQRASACCLQAARRRSNRSAVQPQVCAAAARFASPSRPARPPFLTQILQRPFAVGRNTARLCNTPTHRSTQLLAQTRGMPGGLAHTPQA